MARIAKDAKAPVIEQRHIQHVCWWQRLILIPLYCLIRLWNSTLRIQVSSEAAYLLRSAPSPVIFVFWHNRLFVSSELRRRFRKKSKLYGLVSASKDGAWLSTFLKMLGIESIRGSSSWRGKTALRELIEALKDRNDVAITPDGPRGPCYSFKPGALQLSYSTGAPLLLVNIEFSKAWQLKSWDRFCIPFPFSRLKVHIKQWLPPEDPWAPNSVLTENLRQLLLCLGKNEDDFKA